VVFVTTNGQTDNPRNDQRRERLRTMTLTAWDLRRMRQDDQSPRTRHMVLKTHERLSLLAEAERGVPKHVRSFLKIGREGAPGVLLVHGTDQSPADLVPLARVLNDAGLTVAGILLADYGHGGVGDPKARWRATLQQLRLGYGLIAGVCKEIHVVGVGFGGALALHLAQREKVSGLVLVAPALTPKASIWMRLAQSSKLIKLPFIRRRLGNLVDAFEGMTEAHHLASKIDVPIFGVQCDDDAEVSPESLRFLQKKAKHRHCRFQAFPTGGHDVLGTHGGDGLYRNILEFIQQKH